jgi:hypothetical protein
MRAGAERVILSRRSRRTLMVVWYEDGGAWVPANVVGEGLDALLADGVGGLLTVRMGRAGFRAFRFGTGSRARRL